MSDKFGMLLAATLEVFSQVLEIAGLTEMGKAAEEMLSYLKATIILEPTMSVLCVQQVSTRECGQHTGTAMCFFVREFLFYTILVV